MSFQLNRVLAIARKEIFHIMRDKFTLMMALVLPLILVGIFGTAIDFNLTEIPTAYLDLDKTQNSRALIKTFGSSNFFQMKQVDSPNKGIGLIQSEKARALVIIPPGAAPGGEVQILLDAADNSAAGSILSYVGDIQSRISGIDGPIKLKTRYLFNPELSSKWFIVPGLVVVIMALLSILLTALTVAREWESGSMEILLSTPVKPIEVIIGKLFPYGVLCIIAIGLVYLMARIVFEIPFEGSHIVFLAGTLIFLITYLAQGLLISVVTRKQMIAMQISMVSGFLPSQLLSGFIFPIESMPDFFQYFTMILPARWFMVIARDSFLQGSSFWDLKEEFSALIVIMIIFIFISVKRFKKDLEP